VAHCAASRRARRTARCGARRPQRCTTATLRGRASASPLISALCEPWRRLQLRDAPLGFAHPVDPNRQTAPSSRALSTVILLWSVCTALMRRAPAIADGERPRFIVRHAVIDTTDRASSGSAFAPAASAYSCASTPPNSLQHRLCVEHLWPPAVHCRSAHSAASAAPGRRLDPLAALARRL
jgi:hypothetical protein